MERNKNTIPRGVILLAVRHPYYGRLAFNLAATIKASEAIPIAIVHDDKSLTHLSDSQKSVFDHFVSLPKHIGEGFAPKLHLNELSPFEETIFFDADMLWLPVRKPSELFEELGIADFSAITEGWCELETLDCTNVNQMYYFWADVKEIKEAYGLKSGKLYQWRSEVIYFKKTDKIDQFFRTAQEIHANPNLKSIKSFATYVPDELSINISAAIHGIGPHKEKWTPAYWYKLFKDQIPGTATLYRWYLISFGGNAANGSLKKIYDQIASMALKKIGKQHVFGLHSKNSYLTERAKM